VSSEKVPPEATPEPAVSTARQKFSCPACGAEAHWNAARQALICPFCGTESPVPLEARGADTVIAEHDLVAALETVPQAMLGWQAAKVSVRCQSCQAVSVFDAGTVGQRCQFCGSAQLLPYEQVADPFRPESVLPFKVSEPQARELVRAWYGRQWFAPNTLARKALTDTVHGIYLPYWTFDAHVDARWTADSGEYYYVGSGKNRQRRVKWTPASGDLTHTFDDELVPASKGVHASLLRGVEPFPTASLIPYDPGYLAGWTVERYQIDLPNAAAEAKRQMHATIERLCGQQVPGDTHRNLVVRATYSNERFKHVLMPVWLVTYDYRAKSYQVAANGVTGRICGERPWSWIKIALVVLAVLIVLYVVYS
jgi:Zn finger protein HypA/HybF involved in hydrogenase expression